MSRYDGLIIPRSYNEYINKTDAATLQQALQLPGVMDAAPTENSNNPVKSGGVYGALKQITSLPTDAVLHYSFDEVPDLPDGTADYRPDFYTTDGGWATDNYCAFSHSNGILKMQCTGNVNEWRAYQNFAGIANKIIMLKVKPNFDNARFRLSGYDGSSYTDIFNQYIPKGEWTSIIGVVPSTHISYIRMSSEQSSDATRYFEIKDFYIGDGSYSTPIIDNVNGQYNAINNGLIATMGVSGKGVKCLNGKYASIYNFHFSSNFSLSIWVNPENNTNGKVGFVFSKPQVFGLQNGTDSENYLKIYGNYSDGTVFNFNIGSLLSIGWSHIVIVKNGTTLNYYKNGVLVSTNTLETSELHDSTWEAYIARNSNTRPQSYDDLLIFDRALTENEVIALYLNKANTPKYYNWADWKLSQTETATRSAPETKSQPTETPSEETQKEK